MNSKKFTGSNDKKADMINAMDTHCGRQVIQVKLIEITEHQETQRLDNFLIGQLKGVPKSFIYRIIRKGEVRVNKGRKVANYRLQKGDVVRIPPIRTTQTENSNLHLHPALKESLTRDILFEDDWLLAVNKPSGFAVHGGTGIKSGVIEGLRKLRPDAPFLELVHRLDRDTSGCLLIAKKRSALKQLHELFRTDQIEKTYLALLSGQWRRKMQLVDIALMKNVGKGGERMVMASRSGKKAETIFRRIKLFNGSTLVEALPRTGRTHQIRVHAASIGHPIIQDDKYGNDEINREFKKRGYTRLFLHAQKLVFKHPGSNQMVTLVAPLAEDLAERLAYEK